ncbi:MAG: PAC2 family protein [Candidatus Omnitrophota bacterium]
MIKIHKKPKLKNPIMIAAWPGMGNVALKAATYLKDQLKAVEFAEIDMGDFFSPTEAQIDNGLLKMPAMPKGKFYFRENKTGKNDLVIFISQAQPRPEKGYEYSKGVLEAAEKLKVDLIYTFAAMPLPIDHLKKPQVWAAATEKKLIEQLKKIPLKIMTSGQISGLNGLFLAVAREQGFSGICMLAEIPLYAIQIENPNASLAILEVLTKLIDFKLDFTQLQASAKTMQEEIERLIEYLKTPEEELTKPITEEEIEKIRKILSSQDRLPDSAKKSIDEFFGLAKKDIKRASELKKELDKWGVYKQYEDRFLDLFKKSQRRSN